MADLKISALTASTTPLAGTEVLPIVQSSTTKQVSVANLTAGRSVGAAKVNINTSTEFGLLNVSSTGANDSVVTIGDFSTPANSVGIYGRVNGAGVFSIKTAGVAIRLSSDSGLANPVDILNGNVVPGTAAKGINFTANTPAAGSTSQLFNWYEEGTWTPVLRGSVSDPTVAGVVSGAYTRTGRLVTFTLEIITSSVTGGSGTLTVSGLPFTTINRTVCGCATVNFTLGMTVPATAAFPSSNTTSISLYVNNFSNTPSTVANLAGGTNYLYIAGQYFV